MNAIIGWIFGVGFLWFVLTTGVTSYLARYLLTIPKTPC